MNHSTHAANRQSKPHRNGSSRNFRSFYFRKIKLSCEKHEIQHHVKITHYTHTPHTVSHIIWAPWIWLTSGTTVGLRELVRTDVLLELFLPITYIHAYTLKSIRIHLVLRFCTVSWSYLMNSSISSIILFLMNPRVYYRFKIFVGLASQNITQWIM